jgi:RND family efflux transporter MFP subunit
MNHLPTSAAAPVPRSADLKSAVSQTCSLPPPPRLSLRRMAILLGLLSAITLLPSCGPKRHEQQSAEPDLPVVEVQVQKVEARTVPIVEEVTGTVRARLRATLEARATGRISEIPVVLGQKLRAGDLVARLEAPELAARLEQAEAAFTQAEREWKRVSGLYGQQAATRADADAADSRCRVAKAAVTEARVMLGYLEIIAPFDGVVTRKPADRGDLATPGKPLVDLEAPENLQLEADVPEAIAGQIREKAPLTVRIGSGPDELAGIVSEIAPNADPASRTFRVKLDLPSRPGLMSGQFGRVLVPVGESTGLRIPITSVVQRGQLEIAFVVQDQRARLHLVKTGRRVGGETEVLSGLDSGDRVVVDRAVQLEDGQAVTVK